MLLYGPPGNGKTSIALSFARVFNDVIYVPYAITVEGQIIRVYDPSFHVVLNPTSLDDESRITFTTLAGFPAAGLSFLQAAS